MRKNKYGLKRHIPEKIKREVRIRCGFGCVVCGCMIYEYEHFDPPFESCQSHNPKGITLLCGRHHSNKTRGFFPLSEIVKANSNPYAKRGNFWEDLTYSTTPPFIIFGNNRFNNFRDIIIVNNNKILSIDPPEIKGSPYRITACFFDQKNNSILNINKNIISGNKSNVDITTEGGIVSIKSLEKPSTTFLKMSLKNQPYQFELSEMNMIYEDNKIVIDKQGNLHVRNLLGGGMTFNGSNFNAQPSSNAFCLKIHSCGKIEGVGCS